jgi:GT2 family glycosyltransferase
MVAVSDRTKYINTCVSPGYDMCRCSIIILTYNSADDIRKTLQSVLDQDVEFNYEVIVADNDSSDGTAEIVSDEFPDIRMLEFNRNWGASKGYNKALAKVEGKYVVFLNPDATATSSWLQRFVNGIESADATAAHCCIYEPGDEHYDSKGKAVPKAVMKVTDVSTSGYVYKREHPSSERPFRTLDLHGAAMILDTAELDQLTHHFEEAFFLFADDIDMALRLNVLGKKVVLVPDAVIHHHQEGLADPSPIWWFVKKHLWATSGRLLSFYKNMYLPEFLLALPLLVLGGALNARELRLPIWKRVVYGVGGAVLSLASVGILITRFTEVRERRKRILKRRDNGRFWLLKKMVFSSPPRINWH